MSDPKDRPMDGKELRETLRCMTYKATEDLEWPGDEAVATAIAAAVRDHLGITKEVVDAVDQCMAAPKYRTTAERRGLAALTALLDASEAE